jgi:hypothetical protein
MTKLEAKFIGLGSCKELDQMRTRRMSEFCMVPLTQAVSLLVDPYCVKHPLCVEAGFIDGSCCPIGGVEHKLISRCCCSFLQDPPVFNDEQLMVVMEYRFEYFTIQFSEFLSQFALIFSFVVFIIIRNPLPDHPPWILVVPKIIQLKVYAFAQEQTMAAKFVRAIAMPRRQAEIPLVLFFKAVIWVGVSFFAGGGGIWMLLSIYGAKGVLNLLRMFSRVLRYCKSDFDPTDPEDLLVRKAWAKYPLRNDAETPGGFQRVELPLVLIYTAVGFGVGVGHFSKFIIDMMLMRLIISILMSQYFGQQQKGLTEMIEDDLKLGETPAPTPAEEDLGYGRRLEDVGEGFWNGFQREKAMWGTFGADVWGAVAGSEETVAAAVGLGWPAVPEVVSRCLKGVGFDFTELPDVVVRHLQQGATGPGTHIEAREIFAALPNMMAPVQGIAEEAWNVLKNVIGLFSVILSAVFGVPLCEGPATLIAAMMITAVTSAIFVWLNYDQFGLFASGKRTVRSTKALTNKTLRTVLITGSMSIVFALTQCMVLMLQRALAMAFSVDPSAWMCPWPDELTMIISRGMISVLGIVAYIAFIASANGHFLGQDYLLDSLMIQIDMDLSDLDPNAEDETGLSSFMRTDVFAAMLPSTFGLWFDNWNVKAFLMRERAFLYAEKFRDPQVCTFCGVVHVPYEELVKATAKTISLCWQLIPLVGIVFSKWTEYANFPPLYYRGKAMPCLYTQDLFTYSSYPELPPLTRFATPQTRIFRIFATISSYAIRYHLWWLRALLSMGLFVIALLFVFIIDPSNISVRGPILFWSGFIVALVKGLGDQSLWVWANFIHTQKDRAEREREKAEKLEKKIMMQREIRELPDMILRAQVLMAGTLAVTVTTFQTFQHGLRTLIFNTLVASLAGICFVYFALLFSVIAPRLERLGPWIPVVVRFVLMSGICIWVMLLVWDVSKSDMRCTLTVGIVTITVQVLVDWTHVEGKVHHLPTQFSAWVPGMVGIPMCSFFGALIGVSVWTTMGAMTLGYMMALFCGLGIGLIFAVGLSVMLNNKPMVRGLGWGTFAFLATAAIHPVFALGMFGATFLFVAVKNEWIVMEEMEKELRTKPKKKLYSLREDRRLRKEADARSEDTISTQEEESEDEESVDQSTSNESQKPLTDHNQQSVVGGTVGLTRNLSEILANAESHQNTPGFVPEFPGRPLSRDEAFDSNVMGGATLTGALVSRPDVGPPSGPPPPRALPPASDRGQARSQVKPPASDGGQSRSQVKPPASEGGQSRSQVKPPASEGGQSRPAKSEKSGKSKAGPLSAPPPPVRGAPCTPPGTPPPSPRKTKRFEEAPVEEPVNYFGPGSELNEYVKPVHRLSLANTGQVAAHRNSNASATGNAWLEGNVGPRASVLSQGSRKEDAPFGTASGNASARQSVVRGSVPRGSVSSQPRKPR